MAIAPVTSSDVSLLRAWIELVILSVRRQARMRQMVWIALALMGLAIVAVALVTYLGSWRLSDRRPRGRGPTYAQTVTATHALLSRSDPAGALPAALSASLNTALE